MSDKVDSEQFSFDKSAPGVDTGRIHRGPLLEEIAVLTADLAATQLNLVEATVLIEAYRKWFSFTAITTTEGQEPERPTLEEIENMRAEIERLEKK